MKFSVLGPLEVCAETGTIELSPKLRDLLAAMLCRPGTTISADRLIAALWGEDAPRSAAKTLQGYIHHLRKALGEERVLHRAPGYLLRITPGELDADQFTHLTQQARQHTTDGQHTTAASLLDEALSLWRSAPYEGQEHIPALADEATRLAEMHMAATEELAGTRLTLGQHTDAATTLRPILAADPYRERPRVLLMLALYRMGRTAEALAIARQGRKLLAHDLGLDPGPALTQLEHDILNNHPRLTTPPSLTTADAASAINAIGGTGQTNRNSANGADDTAGEMNPHYPGADGQRPPKPPRAPSTAVIRELLARLTQTLDSTPQPALPHRAISRCW